MQIISAMGLRNYWLPLLMVGFCPFLYSETATPAPGTYGGYGGMSFQPKSHYFDSNQTDPLISVSSSQRGEDPGDVLNPLFEKLSSNLQKIAEAEKALLAAGVTTETEKSLATLTELYNELDSLPAMLMPDVWCQPILEEARITFALQHLLPATSVKAFAARLSRLPDQIKTLPRNSSDLAKMLVEADVDPVLKETSYRAVLKIRQAAMEKLGTLLTSAEYRGAPNHSLTLDPETLFQFELQRPGDAPLENAVAAVDKQYPLGRFIAHYLKEPWGVALHVISAANAKDSNYRLGRVLGKFSPEELKGIAAEFPAELTPEQVALKTKILYLAGITDGSSTTNKTPTLQRLVNGYDLEVYHQAKTQRVLDTYAPIDRIRPSPVVNLRLTPADTFKIPPLDELKVELTRSLLAGHKRTAAQLAMLLSTNEKTSFSLQYAPGKVTRFDDKLTSIIRALDDANRSQAKRMGNVDLKGLDPALSFLPAKKVCPLKPSAPVQPIATNKISF